MRAEKVQMLNVVKELLQDKPVFIIGFNALTVAEFSEFRAKLAALGAEVHVVKNTMITKAWATRLWQRRNSVLPVPWSAETPTPSPWPRL